MREIVPEMSLFAIIPWKGHQRDDLVIVAWMVDVDLHKCGETGSEYSRFL